jgi:NADH-ubiquinone oxidoreductase chain 6
MLYEIYEFSFKGYSVYSLDLLTLLGILLGIFVIISKNPIISVLFLIGLFLAISGYLVLTGLNFIGLFYLLVYIGAVSILFLFILMLINVRISELLIDSFNSIPLAIFLGSLFLFFVNTVLPFMIQIGDTRFLFKSIMDLITVTSKSWDVSLAPTSHITSMGNILYTSHGIWLMIISIILLVAMVGCIVITLKPQSDKAKDTENTGDYAQVNPV